MEFDKLTGLVYRESFHHAFENEIGYSKHWVEIFKNPTKKELREIGEYNIGMVLTPKDVFVWNRSNAYHKHIFKELKTTNGIPILFDFENKKCFCLITDAVQITPYYHNPKVKEIITNNPWMKQFSEIDIEYFDQAIVGNWEDL